MVEVRVGRLHLQAIQQPCQWALTLASSRSHAATVPSFARARRAWGRGRCRASPARPPTRRARAQDCSGSRRTRCRRNVRCCRTHRAPPPRAGQNCGKHRGTFRVAIVAGDLAPELRHPPPARLVPVGEIAGILRQARTRRCQDATVLPHRLGDVLGVLEIERVLQEVPFGGELAKGEYADPAQLVAGVRDPQPPILEILIERTK